MKFFIRRSTAEGLTQPEFRKTGFSLNLAIAKQQGELA